MKDYMGMIGKFYRTPFELSGVVEVIELDEQSTEFYGKPVLVVEYLHDHPHGYPAVSMGLYFAEELTQEVPRCLSKS